MGFALAPAGAPGSGASSSERVWEKEIFQQSCTQTVSSLLQLRFCFCAHLLHVRPGSRLWQKLMMTFPGQPQHAAMIMGFSCGTCCELPLQETCVEVAGECVFLKACLLLSGQGLTTSISACDMSSVCCLAFEACLRKSRPPIARCHVAPGDWLSRLVTAADRAAAPTQPDVCSQLLSCVSKVRGRCQARYRFLTWHADGAGCMSMAAAMKSFLKRHEDVRGKSALRAHRYVYHVVVFCEVLIGNS